MRKCLTEEEEQVCIFEWADLHMDEFPALRLLRGGLEGVRMPIGLAVKAKKLGMLKGSPDIHLPVSRMHAGRIFHAFYIELKAMDGKLTKDYALKSDPWRETEKFSKEYTMAP